MVKARDGARYLNLRMEPASEEAKKLVAKVGQDIRATGAAKRQGSSSKHLLATGAFVADLLKVAAEDPTRFSYRPMRTSTFTGERIGHRSLKQVVDGALAANLILVRQGSGGGTLIGEATRFRATGVLLKLAKSFDVEAPDWQRHFRAIPRPAMIAEPLVLKSTSTLVRGQKRQGIRIPIDRSLPKVVELARQVDEINAFFAGISIEPDSEHYAFQRIFNQGNLPEFDWNKGGRLYSMGDSYQQRKSAERGKMKLSGQPVVEIDIRASFLTILHAILGASFTSNVADPYHHPEIPRGVMKGWVVMTLGHNRFQRAWSSDMIADYRERTGGKLGKDYPIKIVREEALKRLPVLEGWETCELRWGDLQFIESEAIIGSVHELATSYGVPALPVHDSIIVPVSQEALARSVLTAKFRKHVGVEPMLTSK